MLRRATLFSYGRPAMPPPFVASATNTVAHARRAAVAKWLGPAVMTHLALTHGVPMTSFRHTGAADASAAVASAGPADDATLEEAFSRLDVDGDGYIAPRELRCVATALAERLRREEAWSAAAANGLVSDTCTAVSTHSRKGISYAQFRQAMTGLRAAKPNHARPTAGAAMMVHEA